MQMLPLFLRRFSSIPVGAKLRQDKLLHLRFNNFNFNKIAFFNFDEICYSSNINNVHKFHFVQIQ